MSTAVTGRNDLAASASREDLRADKSDNKLVRVATFCADQAGKPPTLGAFAHFLQTAIHSQQRRKTSALLGCFLKLVAEWTGSHWLLDPKGLYCKLNALTPFRNRAAHIDELGMAD